MQVNIETQKTLDKRIMTDDGWSNKELESSKNIDWNNRSDRKWLESHLHWAVNNKRAVTIESV